MWTSWLLGHSATSETGQHIQSQNTTGELGSLLLEVINRGSGTDGHVEQLSASQEHRKAEQHNVRAQELPAGSTQSQTTTTVTFLPSVYKTLHILVSRWVRSLVCLTAAVLQLQCAFFFLKSCETSVQHQDSTANVTSPFPEQKSLSERPSLLQETGNTFSHLGAGLRLLHHLFFGGSG